MTNSQKIIEAWTNLKEKMKNSWKNGKVVVYQDYAASQRVNINLVEHQFELGQILIDLGWKSVKPVVDWTELTLAIHNFKNNYEEQCKSLVEALNKR